jgi:dephospho-CoA kinase
MAVFIAVTGAIGSGKTTVLKRMLSLGYECLSADEVIQTLYACDQGVIAKIKHIAPQSFDHKGVLNKALLRQWCIENNQFHRLEALVHPFFFRFCIQWMHERIHKQAFYFLEVPLLFETKSQMLFHKVLTVYTPCFLRQERLLNSRSISSQEIETINAKQISWQGGLLSLSDCVINNAYGNKALDEKIQNFLRTLYLL